jgi:hypothetical protein
MKKRAPKKASEIQDTFNPIRLIVGLVGLTSFSYVFYITEETLVDPTWLLISGFLTGLVIVVALKTKANFFNGTLLAVSSVLINLPLVLNESFADKVSIELKQAIIKKNYKSDNAEPSVVINYNGLVKTIRVYYGVEMDSAAYVILTANKGLFGYYVITHKKLAKL